MFLVLGVSFSIFFGALILIPSVWVCLFPSLLHLGPLIRKIRNRKYEPQHFLTRFELSSWGCMCLWMVIFPEPSFENNFSTLGICTFISTQLFLIFTQASLGLIIFRLHLYSSKIPQIHLLLTKSK